MRRRAVTVILAACVAVTLAALPAWADFVTQQNLGRRQVQYTAGSAAWLGSAQVQYGDTNGNFLTDSERGRCAVLEQAGLSRVRITACAHQQEVDTNGNSIPDTWVNKLVNETDHVADSYAVSATPSARLCFANPNLTRHTRVRNFHVVRRASDSALFYRTTTSGDVLARALASDPGCKSSADLAVTKTVVDIPDPEGADDLTVITAPDDTFEYRVTVTNPAGGATATDVTVADDYPNELDPPQPGPGCALDVGDPDVNVVCEAAFLEPGRSIIFTITARTNGSTPASFENIASLITLEQPDPNLANNSDSATITVGAPL
jgi:uncharacterized repeat protein (TIGR01451 family)